MHVRSCSAIESGGGVIEGMQVRRLLPFLSSILSHNINPINEKFRNILSI